MQDEFQNPNQEVPPYSVVNCPESAFSRITNQVPIPLISGAENVTPYFAQASTASSSGITVNCVIPSLETVLYPVAFLVANATITCQNSAVGANNYPLNLGASETWNSFPLQSDMVNMNFTFNSAQVGYEMSEVLPLLKKTIPKATRAKYSSVCPTSPDVFFNYSNAVGTMYDPFALVGKTLDEYNRAGWSPDSITVTQNTQNAAPNVGALQTAILNVKFVEPILLDPFSLSVDESNGGLNNLSTFRMISQFIGKDNMKMIQSSSANFKITNVAFDASSTGLQLFYLTPHASQQFKRTSVHRIPSIVRSATALQTPVVGRTDSIDVTAVQLGVMPKKIMIGLRKLRNSQTSNDPDVWLPISSVNLTLANRGGLLSSATQQELYAMSVEAGLQETSWTQFCGKGYGALAGTTLTVTPMAGSPVILDVAKHLSCESYYAPGSIGAFNFYGKISYTPTAISATAGSYEAVVLFISDALLINSMGGSTVQYQLIDKETVLKTQNEAPSHADPDKIVYGGARWMRKILNKSGNGRSGGDGAGHSGGGRSGGSNKLKEYI